MEIEIWLDIRYSTDMGEAAQQYMKTVGGDPRMLPQTFRWQALWETMLGSAITSRATQLPPGSDSAPTPAESSSPCPEARIEALLDHVERMLRCPKALCEDCKARAVELLSRP